MVDDASVERPVTVKLESVVVASAVVPDTVRLVTEAFVVVEFPIVAVVEFKLVIVPEADVSELIVPLVIVVVANVDVPVTVNCVAVAFVAERFVMVEVPKLAFVAVKLSKNALKAERMLAKNDVEVAPPVILRVEIVVVANVVVPVTTKAPVVVEFIVVKLFNPGIDVAYKEPSTVRFVAVALPKFEPPVTVKSEIVVVARLETPNAVKVPCEVSEDVAVITPPVIVLSVAFTAERKLAKKDPVVVPFVRVSLVTVVVPKLVLPSTEKERAVVALPSASTVN